MNETKSRLQKKKTYLAQLMRQQLSLKRLVARNRDRKNEEKAEAKYKKLQAQNQNGTSKAAAKVTDTNQLQLTIKLPFVLTKIQDTPKNELFMRELHQTRLELVSNLPMQCFGDTDILGMMGMGEVYQSKDLEDLLGPEFAAIPSLFSQA